MLFTSSNVVPLKKKTKQNKNHHHRKTLKHFHLLACIEKIKTWTPRCYTLVCQTAN